MKKILPILVLVLLARAAVGAAPAFVQMVRGFKTDGISSPVSMTIPSVGAQHKLIVCIRDSEKTVTSVTGGGLNWHYDRHQNDYGPGQHNCDIWSAYVPSAGTVNLTVSFSQGTLTRATRIIALEYSGLADAPPVSVSGSSGLTAMAIAGNVTATQNNSLIVCAAATEGDVASSFNDERGSHVGEWAPGTGFVFRDTPNVDMEPDQKLGVEDKVVSAGTYSAYISFGSVSYDIWTASAAVYAPADGSVPPTNPVISVTPGSWDYGVLANPSTSNKVFTVQNVGEGTLVGTSSVAAPFAIVGQATYSVVSGGTATITVQFAPRTGQVGVSNGVVNFTGGGGASVQVSGGTPLSGTFGAGAGSISAPFVVNGNGSVSQSTETLDPTLGGSAAYRFNIANAGPYSVTINVSAPNESANSCFVNIDGQPISPDHIWDVPVNAGFVNTPVTWRLTGGTSAQVWTLSAGMHTLVIRGREPALAFSQIAIVPYTPGRPTPPAPPTNVRVIASH